MSYNSILASAPLTSTNYHLKMIGTTIGNSLIWDNGTNVGIGNTNTSYTLDVSGTLRNTTSAYFATASGSVGIGTTSPLEQLNLMGANAYTSKIRFSYGSSATSYYTNFGYNSDGNKAYLQIADGGAASTIMTWNYNGNVGIGTSSPGQILHISGSSIRPQIEGTGNGGYSSLRFVGKNSGGTSRTFEIGLNITADDVWQVTNGSSAFLNVNTSGNVGIGTTSPTNVSGYSALTLNNTTGSIIDLLSNTTLALRIASDTGQSYLAEERNLPLWFATNGTERMRITSGGDVGIANTNSAGYRLLVTGKDNSSSNYAFVVTNSSQSSLLYVRNDGSCWISQSAWVYGSDERLKENINYIETGLDKVLALKPTKFDYIDGSKNNIGWIAQDIQEVIPEAVIVNTSDDKGYLGIKSDFIVPYLVKAIQELSAKNEELSNRLIKLESK